MPLMQPIVTTYPKGRGLYAIWFHKLKGFFNWTLMVWEAKNSAHWLDYVIDLADSDSLGVYSGMPDDLDLDVIPTDLIFEKKFAGDPLTLQPADPGDDCVGNGQSQGQNIAAISGLVASALRMALSAGSMESGKAIAGVLSVTSMTTNLTAVVNGSFVGRSVVWTAGNLKNCGARIVGYDGTTKKLSFSVVPVAPVADDPFVIV